jgi:hypothetical protein
LTNGGSEIKKNQTIGEKSFVEINSFFVVKKLRKLVSVFEKEDEIRAPLTAIGKTMIFHMDYLFSKPQRYSFRKTLKDEKIEQFAIVLSFP